MKFICLIPIGGNLYERDGIRFKADEFIEAVLKNL